MSKTKANSNGDKSARAHARIHPHTTENQYEKWKNNVMDSKLHVIIPDPIIAMIRHECQRRHAICTGEALHDDLELFVRGRLKESKDEYIIDRYANGPTSMIPSGYMLKRALQMPNTLGLYCSLDIHRLDLLCYYANRKNWIDTLYELHIDLNNVKTRRNTQKSLPFPKTKAGANETTGKQEEGGFTNEVLNNRIERRFFASREISTTGDFNEEFIYYMKRIELAKTYPVRDIQYELFKKEDIRLLRFMHSDKYGLDEKTWDSVEERFNFNNSIIKGIKLVTPYEELMLGFLILYPITKECNALLRTEKLSGSSQFEPRDIATNSKSTDALYISWVVGFDPDSKLLISLKLREELEARFRDNPFLSTVYVRPTTPDGERNVHRYNFNKLSKTSELYYQQVSP